MLRTIARVEFLQIVRDGRFRFCATALALLLAMALAAGWTHASRVTAEREVAQKDARQVWLEQADKNPHSAAHFGSYVYKPLTRLALLDPGIDSYTGTSVYLEAHRQNADSFPPVQDRPALQRFGELTAAFVMQTILPLMIIVLTFGTMSGEWESGALRQALSVGVSRRCLAAGKATGILLALAVLVIPALLSGSLVLWMFSPSEAPVTAGRLLGMNVAWVLYLAGVLAVALAISASAPSSRVALILLLGYWAANVLIIPRVAAAVSTRLAPAASATEFQTRIENDMKNGLDGHNPQDRRMAELRERVMKQYGVARVQDLPVNFTGIALQASEEYSNKVFDRHFGERWDAWERQAFLQSAAGFLGPVLPARSISMAMAGTDIAHHRRFLVAAEDHRRTMVRVLNDHLAYRTKPGGNAVAGRELWSQVPDFRCEPPSTVWALRSQGVAFAALTFWVCVAAVAAGRAALRIRVVADR